MEDRDGGQGWRTGMEDRDGGQGWRTGMEDRDGGQGWRTGMEDRDGGLTIRWSAHPIKQLLSKRSQPEDVVLLFCPLHWVATLRGHLGATGTSNTVLQIDYAAGTLQPAPLDSTTWSLETYASSDTQYQPE